MNIYDTTELVEVIPEVQPLNQFLLSAFFPTIYMSMQEHIAFDVVSEAEILAPFVSPCVAGKPMKHEGFSTNTFTPAYLKPKHAVKPCQAMKRKAGEKIGGELSPAERFDAAVNDTLAKQERSIQRRLEWMAAQALQNGSVLVTGEDYPDTLVDFGRKAEHTIQLTGAAAWDQATSTPVDDIEDWSGLVLEAIGVGAADVVMTPDAWKLAKKHEDFVDLLDYRRGVDEVPLVTPQVAAKAYYKGMLGGFRIWVYDGTFVDEAGDTQRMLDPHTVLVIANGVEGLNGYQAFGAIQDVDALVPMERFPKMWKQEDPSCAMLMTQSAPLIIPTRANAVVAVTVVDAP